MDSVLMSPLIKSFMAGAFSGTCSTILFQPLDLVKTRLQKSVNFGTRLGMVTEFTNVVRQENLRGLWCGLTPSISRCVPGIGIYFTSLHWLKTSFGSDQPHPIESIMMGASARSLAGIIVLPFTVVKIRYESGEFKYRGMFQALGSTYTKEGLKGLYSGLAPTLVRDVPFSGVYLMFYTILKEKTLVQGSPIVNFSNGIVAGAMASLITQPADVVKTHMQLYPQKYDRVASTIVALYQQRGFAGFLRGVVPRTIRRTLMSAMAWTVYEEVMRIFHLKT